ncbi:MAG: PQQ-binding-like beta-propeller repeat protein [Anaerolineaceae bacterium]|nr:PQQ-binding-like beta-propeller repeat protein [Anaerolineaceae bacterium]
MKTKQKNLRWTLLFLLLAVSVLLSACSGGASRIAASSWPGFTVDGETIYVSSGRFVRALKLENGNQLWQYPAEADKVLTFYAPPVVLDGMVIAGDYQNAIHGLKADSGSQDWVFADGGKRFIASGMVVDDLVLIPSAAGKLYALNSAGVMDWSVELSNEAIWAKPVYDGETVYVASMDHSLYALEISEAGARQKWSLDVGGAMVASPGMDEDGNLYMGTMTQKLVAVSSSGRELWRFDAQGAIWGTPVVHEGLVMFGDLSGTIYALSTNSGAVEWTITVDGPVIGSGALLDDGVAFAVEEAGVQAVSFSGVKNWSHPVDGDIQAGLVQAGDFVLVAVTNGEKLLIALDPANGNERWSTPAK